jgi:hypothetical protein
MTSLKSTYNHFLEQKETWLVLYIVSSYKEMFIFSIIIAFPATSRPSHRPGDPDQKETEAPVNLFLIVVICRTRVAHSFGKRGDGYSKKEHFLIGDKMIIYIND